MAEGEPAFTPQDAADLPVQEGKVKQSGIEQATALREIRSRKLWMLHRNDDGSRKYKTFDDYCAEHLGYSRQWVTQQTKWLVRVETLVRLRSQGANVPEMISAHAVSGLWQLEEIGQGATDEERAESALAAVIQEAQEDGLTLTADNLRTVCERRVAYSRGKKSTKPFVAPTYSDYKQDRQALLRLGTDESRFTGLVEKAQGQEDDNDKYFQ